MHTQGFRLTRAGILLAAVLICGLIVTPVSAHALLQRSNPEANAILASAPAQVELFFSESLEPSLSSLTVLDANAQVVDQRDVKVDPDDPAHMTVSLRSLAEGIYTVSWKAISATDGHLTSGSFPFAVGSGQAAALSSAGGQHKQIPLSTGALLIQWLEVLALTILAAGVPFQSLIWRPALQAESQDLPGRGTAGTLPPQKPPVNLSIADPPAWKSLTIFSLAGFLVLLAADLLVQAGQTGGNDIVPFFSVNVARILLDTRLGSIWLLRLLLALLYTWLALSRPNPWKVWSALGTGLLLLFTLSLTSHAAAEPQPLLPVLADWLHLVAVSLWIGGLVFFVPAIRHIHAIAGVWQTRLTSRLITRFSALALVCVGLIGVTGVYTAVLRIGTLPALFSSLYGQALILKLVLAALLLSLGALNLRVISPRLKQDRLLGRGNPPLVRRFGHFIAAEVSLGILVLLSASLLASLPPVVATATSPDQNRSLQADDLREELNISPGRVGLNTFTLQITSNGQPLTLAKEVILRFSAIQQNLPPSEIQLVSQGSGIYRAKGSYLSLPGAWQIQTIVRRDNQFDAYANLNLTFQNPASGSASSQNPHIAGGLLLVIGVVYALLMLAKLPKPLDFLPLPSRFALPRGSREGGRGVRSNLPISTLRIGVAVLPMVILLTFGIVFLTSPLPSTQGVVNPIPANNASVSAGKALYTDRCAVCHGATGKGDGPAGIVMRPPPADLTLHAVPGVHTDAQLFQWISQGYPGTQMPAFQSKLSDTDRWNLVNFIRSLAPR